MESKVKTILLEFKITNPDQFDKLVNSIISKLGSLGHKFELVFEDGVDDVSRKMFKYAITRKMYKSTHGILNLTFTSPFCTLNLEITKGWPHTNAELQSFYDSLRNLDLEQSPNFIPILNRAITSSLSPYFTTSDDRLVEYGIKAILHDTKSSYQRVQIVETIDHGNLLILDGAVNLAENDTIPYTQALMNIPQDLNLYQDAQILILGGGDGGLLKSVQELSSKPKKVIMVDLDEEVVKACSKFMKKTCGNYLEDRETSTQQVIIGDALEFMENCQEFDIIFGDLTDIPVDSSVTDSVKTHSISSTTQEAWNFIEKVLHLAFNVLKPSGKYYAHCNGKSVPLVLKQYEELLDGIRIDKDGKKFKTSWSKTESFVPSFMETWIFYQVALQEIKNE